MNKEFKKQYRRYKKAERKYKRELIKYIKKNEYSFDWYSIVEVILKMIKRRLEYFKKGDNVYTCDESVKHCIDTLEHAYNLGLFATCDEHFTLDPYEKHSAEEYFEVIQKENTAYEEFFTYVGKNIRSWWD